MKCPDTGLSQILVLWGPFRSSIKSRHSSALLVTRPLKVTLGRSSIKLIKFVWRLDNRLYFYIFFINRDCSSWMNGNFFTASSEQQKERKYLENKVAF